MVLDSAPSTGSWKAITYEPLTFMTLATVQYSIDSSAGALVKTTIVLHHSGDALTFVASLTGGSILMLGPCTLGRIPAPGFSSNRRSFWLLDNC